MDDFKAALLENPAVKALGDFQAYIDDNADAIMLLPITLAHTNIYGIVHGGIFVTMLDTVMGYASYIEKQASVVTVNFTTSFISNCKEGETVKIVGRVINATKKIVVAQGEVMTETGKLLVVAQGTFLVLDE